MSASASAFLALLVAALPVGAASGQVVLSGRVSDRDSGAALVAATIQVEGTYRGTITNEEGRFSIRVEAVPVHLLVRHIGYATAREVADGRQELHVRLAPEPLTLAEVVVTGEDPAVAIMRRVIERKRAWRADLERFRADAYSRLVIENDTGIVSITESRSDYWWDRELGRREIVRGSRRTANLPIEAIVPAALSLANLYDDDVELAGSRLVGVTHPDALSVYDFRLEGTRVQDGRTVYDIAVRPRSRLASAFVGRVSVLDGEYALLHADLRPGESFLFPPPIQYFEVDLRQQFASFGGPYMLPVDFRAEYELKVGFRRVLDFPVIRIGQVTRLDGYDVNGPRADSVFAGTREFTTDSAAVALAPGGTVVPMTAREEEALVRIDSTETLERAFRPTGILARVARIQVSSGADSARDARTGTVGLQLRPEVRVDRVEGIHGLMGAAFRPVSRVRMLARLGYDSAPRTAAWGLRAEVALSTASPGQPVLSLFGDWSDGIRPRVRSRTQGPFFNSIRVLLNGRDYFDYVRRERLEAGFVWNGTTAVTLEVAARIDRDRSVAGGSPVRLTGRRTQRPNPRVPEGSVTSVVLRGRAGARPDGFGLTGATGLSLELEVAPAGQDLAREGFVRVDLRADLRTGTMMRRRLLPMTLDVALTAGHALGATPPQRWGAVDGTMGWSTIGALRTLVDVFYEGDSHVFAGWEHNFRTVPFEIAGAGGLVRRNLNLILSGAHGRTWLSRGARALALHAPLEPGGWHHEIGLSLSGLFGLLRLDLTRRLDAPAWRLGLGSARLF